MVKLWLSSSFIIALSASTKADGGDIFSEKVISLEQVLALTAGANSSLVNCTVKWLHITSSDPVLKSKNFLKSTEQKLTTIAS